MSLLITRTGPTRTSTKINRSRSRTSFKDLQVEGRDVNKATGSKAKTPSHKPEANAVFPQGQTKAKATAGPGQ